MKKMNLKNLLSLVFALVLIFSLMAGCSSSEEPASTQSLSDSTDPQVDETPEPTAPEEETSYNLSFASYLPAGNIFENASTFMTEQFNERSNGTVTMEYYPGASLVSASEVLDGVITGVADMGIVPVVYNAGRLPYMFIFEHPGLRWDSSRAVSNALTDFVNEWELKELDEVQLLLVYGSGPGMVNSTYPIREMADFEGREIRAATALATAMSSYGATPVTIDYFDVYESLRTGIVDGWVGIIPAIAPIHTEEVAKYMTYYPFYNSSYLVIINKDVYNSMSENQQNIVSGVVQEIGEDYLFDSLGAFWEDEGTCKALASFDEIIVMDEEKLDELEAASAHVLDDYALTLDEKGLKGSDALAFIRALAEKYNPMYPQDDAVGYFNDEFLGQYR